MVAALLLTVSRGGYLGLAATVPVAAYLLLRDQKRRRQLIGLLVVVMVTVVLVPASRAVIAHSWDQVLSLREGSSSDSTSFHLDEWRVAARIIEDNPLVGTGPETFPEQFPRYSRMTLPVARVSLFDQYRVESPHNVFLGIAAGSGIPAVVAYVWLLGVVAYLVRRALWAEETAALRVALIAILVAMAGHVITDSFMTAEVTSSWLIWTLMGTGVGLASRPRPRHTQPPRREPGP